MKNNIHFVVIVLLLLACRGGVAQNLGFSQYPLPDQRVKAEYAPQERTGRVFRKVFMGSGSMTFTLAPNPGDRTQWLLRIQTRVEQANVPSLSLQPVGYTFQYGLDSKASILSEENIAIFKNDETRTESAFSVILENDLFLGTNKTIRIENLDTKNQRKNKEWIVGPEDPVVTVPQLLVWIGSIETIPPEGTLVRCVVDERPLPFLVKGAPAGEGWAFTVFPAPNLEASQNPEDYMFQFVFGRERMENPGFIFPNEIWMNVQGQAIKMIRE